MAAFTCICGIVLASVSSLCTVHAVNQKSLAGDAFSDTVLRNYSSVTVHFNISIDNTALYPDLGSVVKTNHDRLSTIMRSMGYAVVGFSSSTSSAFICMHDALMDRYLDGYLD